jgi:signal peptidase I
VTGWAYALRRGGTAAAPAPAPSRSLAIARGLGSFLAWTVAGVAMGIALALLVPLAFHARPLTVMSGSMEPAIQTGDVVVSRQVHPAEVQRGDIVSFRDRERGGLLVTHRVRTITRKGDKFTFVTKGDANNSSERWSVAATDRIGHTMYRLPALGRALAFAHTRKGIVLLVMIPLVLLGTLEIASIWRTDDDEASGEGTS